LVIIELNRKRAEEWEVLAIALFAPFTDFDLSNKHHGKYKRPGLV